MTETVPTIPSRIYPPRIPRSLYAERENVRRWIKVEDGSVRVKLGKTFQTVTEVDVEARRIETVMQTHTFRSPHVPRWVKAALEYYEDQTTE